MVDQKRIPGNHVHTRVTPFVIHESSAQRRYGAAYKTKLVPGIVESVTVQDSKGGKSRKSTWVSARFYLGEVGEAGETAANNDAKYVVQNTIVKEVLVGNLKEGFPKGSALPPKQFLSSYITVSSSKKEPSAYSQACISPKVASKVDGRAYVEVAQSPLQQERAMLANKETSRRSLLSSPAIQFDTIRDSDKKKPAKNANEMKETLQSTKDKPSNTQALKALRDVLLGNDDSATIDNNPVFLKLLSVLNITDKEDETQSDLAKKNHDWQGKNDEKEQSNAAKNEDETNYQSDLEEPPTPFKSTRKFKEIAKASQKKESTRTGVQANLFGSNDEASKTKDGACVAESHGVKWFEDEDNLTKNGIGKPIAPHQWRLKSQYDACITVTSGSNRDKRLDPFDIFMMLLPSKTLKEIVRLTNQRLATLSIPKAPTTEGEILKFIGILVLGTFVEFDNRKDLWTKKSDSKYIPAPNFVKTGMVRDRFLTLFVNIRYSAQPDQKPSGMSSETYRWMLLDVSFSIACTFHKA